MRGDILKQVSDGSLGVCEGYNCECDHLATREIQAETDSFGYESWCLCDNCYKLMLDSIEDEENRIIEEEDEEAPEGKRWLFTAAAQDDHDWYCYVSTNRAECVLAMKRAEVRTEARYGLYRPTIELVDKTKADKVYSRWCHRWDNEE